MPPEEAPVAPVPPAVTMKAHQALEARIVQLEGEVKDLRETVAKAKTFVDGLMAEKAVPKGYKNPFRL